MIDVYVYNNSGSAKRPAKLNAQSGVIRFDDGSYSHVSGESARGCAVIEIPQEVKPEPKPESAPEVTPVAKVEKKEPSESELVQQEIASLEEKKLRLNNKEKKRLKELKAQIEQAKSEE